MKINNINNNNNSFGAKLRFPGTLYDDATKKIMRATAEQTAELARVAKGIGEDTDFIELNIRYDEFDRRFGLNPSPGMVWKIGEAKGGLYGGGTGSFEDFLKKLTELAKNFNTSG